jgi:hypothetical protein
MDPVLNTWNLQISKLIDSGYLIDAQVPILFYTPQLPGFVN